MIELTKDNKDVDDKLNNEKKTGHKFQKGNKFGKGRPKGSISLLTDIKRKFKSVKEHQPEEYEALIDYYWKNEKTRDLLIKMIDGQPKQHTELTGKDGQPLVLQINSTIAKKNELNGMAK